MMMKGQHEINCVSGCRLRYLQLDFRGVARIFQRGGHTVSNIIVMAFSPRNIVGYLFKKAYKGGHVHPRSPSRYALGFVTFMRI